MRSDARATVSELRALGVRSIMLSGDKEAAAHEVAAAVGIAKEDVHAEVKPAGAGLSCDGWAHAGHARLLCLLCGSLIL